MASAIGLRPPASASCLGRHSRLAGRCPNNSSLFPPLAAVVVVALWAYSAENYFFFAFVAACGPLQTHFHGWGRKGKQPLQTLASSPSQSLRASSPKGGALGITVQFSVKPKSFRFRQSLSLWERWHGASRDGEGEDACGERTIPKRHLFQYTTIFACGK